MGEEMSAVQFPSERLMDTALDISKRRKETLRRVKLAIRAGDLETADQLITELVPDDEKSDSTVARFDRRASRRR